ncbi:hypothetical protein Cni_G03825 [Canna indica]|uniref:Reverse transcriptase domain-containing protein n=1 Tax=Canna indica TaxID=4628 RepID=A0AAQ3JRT3_9LILI|nr:hypothetical protein Cni_G03825 [Canna indica]
MVDVRASSLGGSRYKDQSKVKASAEGNLNKNKGKQSGTTNHVVNSFPGSSSHSDLKNSMMHAIKNPLFDSNQKNMKQPNSWASLFKESYVFDNLPEREDLSERFESIRMNSSDEIFIEEELVNYSRLNWTNSLYGKFYVVDLASGFFCFKFANADDVEKVLTNGPWFLRGQVLLLSPWRENFQPMLERIDSIPIWIQFPRLPIEFLQRDILIKLASALGKSLKVDEITLKGNRAKFALLCVLWDLKKFVPNGLWINCSGKRFWQALALENIPKLCYECGKIWHLAYQCVTDRVQVNNEDNANIAIMENNTVCAKENQADSSAKSIHGPWQVLEDSSAMRNNEKEDSKVQVTQNPFFGKGKNIVSSKEAVEKDIVEFKFVNSTPIQIHVDMEMEAENLHKKLTDTFVVAIDAWNYLNMLLKNHSPDFILLVETHTDEENSILCIKKLGSSWDGIYISGNGRSGGAGLMDLEFKGPHFTLCNNRIGGNMTYARLDKNLSKELTYWDKNKIGSLENPVKDSLDELGILEDIDAKGLSNEQDQIRMECLVNKIKALNRQIHMKWWLKATTMWIEQNDRNTKFFQNLVKFKKRKSLITEIQTEQSIISKPKKIVEEYANWYKDLWGSVDRDINNWDTLRNLNWYRVPSSCHNALTNAFSEKEIIEAINSLGRGKAPGPDSYNLEFYINFWDRINESYMSAINSFHESGVIPEFWGNTKLVFIPKTDNAKRITDYRPIALCNVGYKILSKLLVNRCKSFIEDTISKEQMAFVRNRNLHENVLMVSEMLNIIHGSKRKKPYCILKLDLEKAFDRVSWEALKKIWNFMNFPKKLINRLYGCLSSSVFTCSINGFNSFCFKNCKGVRQGDPLSPYFFIMMQELLSLLIKKAVDDGEVKAFKYKKFFISHLFYADDILITISSCRRSVMKVKEILDTYCSYTNHKINVSKSEVIFPGNCSERIKAEVCNILNIKKGTFPIKHLGVFIDGGKLSKSHQSLVVDKASTRIENWASKHISQAGKIVLINSVVNSIPIHSLSTTWINDGVINNYAKNARSFLWKTNSKKKGLHLVKWELVTICKRDGGLGIKDLGVIKYRNEWINGKWLNESDGLGKSSGDALIAARLWKLWKNRNNCMFNGKCSNINPLFFRTLAELNQRCAKEVLNQNIIWGKKISSVSSLQNVYMVSEKNVVNAYCDAAWIEESRNTGIGFQFLGDDLIKIYKCISFMIALDPLSAKLWAIWLCLVKAKLLNIKHLKLFSDCLRAINILQMKFKPPWFLKGLMKDISQIAMALEAVEWVHIKRKGNN